jgi:hypothetical protein
MLSWLDLHKGTTKLILLATAVGCLSAIPVATDGPWSYVFRWLVVAVVAVIFCAIVANEDWSAFMVLTVFSGIMAYSDALRPAFQEAHVWKTIFYGLLAILAFQTLRRGGWLDDPADEESRHAYGSAAHGSY